MQDRGHLWALVLAGGDGARLRPLTTDTEGSYVPKQFCTFDGRDSMVRWAFNRATRLVPIDRVVVVVAEQHRQWWREELSDISPENLVVQPLNRGTAAGLLLPLLEILRRDQLARVLVFPSDHYVADEARLSEAIVEAIQALHRDTSRVVLLGMVPHDEDTGYGWIVPAGPQETVQQVATFVEKPDRRKVRPLIRRGALLNSLILAGTGRTLLHLHALSVPELVGDFVSWRNGSAAGWSELTDLYQVLPSRDFSKEVLQRCCTSLSVVRVPECGWTDLGTPERLRDFQQRQARGFETTA